MMRARRLIGGIVAVAGMMAVACGSAPSSSGSGSSGAKVPLVVYSAQGYDKDTVQAFQKATGIPTKLVDDSTGPLLARIQAEKNNPQWGLLWVDGDLAFASLDRQNMLVRNAEPQVNWSAAARSVLPKNGSYAPSGLTMAAALVYDSSKVSTPPTRWQDLLQPAYRGKLGMNNPAVSGPTYPYVAGMLNLLGGVSQGESFFTQLRSNGLHVYPTNGDTLHAMQTGQIDMATIQSSAILGAMKSNPALKIAFPASVTLLPACMGIDAKAPAAVQAEAKQFESFVLSRQGQQTMQAGDPSGDSLYWPALQDVQPLAGVPQMTSIKYQKIDPYNWGPQEADINRWFVSNIVG